MNYILRYLRLGVLALMPAIACFLLVPQFGVMPVIGGLAVIAAIAVLIGGALLHSTAIGEMSWKNRLAGLLAPWGWAFCGGTLWRGLAASWIAWVLIGVAGTTLATGSGHSSSSSAFPRSGSIVVSGLLLLTWLIDGAALLYVLGICLKNLRPGSKYSLRLMQIMVAIGLILTASVTALLTGYPVLALCISGIPPLTIGILFGLFMSFILALGKNIRWN